MEEKKLRITFHGAAQEVGRSCIEVASDNYRIIFDAGIKFGEEGTEYPVKMKDVDKIDAVFVSHAHLDHTGYLPHLMKAGLDCPVYMTHGTRVLTKILLKDSYGIDLLKNQLQYHKADMKRVFSRTKILDYGREELQESMRFRMDSAGHIPGSAITTVDMDGRKIMYTGDIRLSDTLLLEKANVQGSPDVLICETTYGNKLQNDRQGEIREFIQAIRKTLKDGGSVIIPVFAVGRAQEVIMMIYDKFNVPVYMDGMGIEVCEKMLAMPEFVRDKSLLKTAFSRVKVIKSWKDRKDVMKEKAIFVTTSGMLTGGPVIEYLKHHYFDERTAIFLTGYQVEGTNGRTLLEEGKVSLDGMTVKVKCKVRKFDFSAHADSKALKDMILKLRPKHLCLVHGEPESGQAIKDFAEKRGMKVYLQKPGDTIRI
ncbi:MBL fold metallo-hydrolase [Candidatus Woesearchaeota archaeon]|nr:MBL fold metallo-hydrolase [Candidatus Woesearchaeota archaeon]